MFGAGGVLLDGLLGSFDVMVYWGDRNKGSDCVKAGGSGRSGCIHDQLYDIPGYPVGLQLCWFIALDGQQCSFVALLLVLKDGLEMLEQSEPHCAGTLYSWLSAVLPCGWMHFPVMVLGRLVRLLFQIKVYSGIYWGCSISLCFLTYLLLTPVS